MGLGVNLDFVRIEDGLLYIVDTEVDKWGDGYNAVFLPTDQTQPLFPSVGQHPLDKRPIHEEFCEFGHTWVTLDDIEKADYNQSILSPTGEVVEPSWEEWLDVAAFKDEFLSARPLGVTHILIFFDH